MSETRSIVLGELSVLLPLRYLASRKRYDMPVRWKNLPMADCHLVLLSSNSSNWICLHRPLRVSASRIIRRYRSRSFGSDLAEAGSVGWNCRMRPAEIKKPLALFTALMKVRSTCATLPFTTSSARYSSMASA